MYVSTIDNRSSDQAARLALIFCFSPEFNERQEVSKYIINQPELFLMIQMGGLLFNDLKDCDECTVVYTTNCYHLLRRGVAHCGLAISIKKYLKEKERIMKTQIFHHAKI
jgi:hypothetical protein